MYLPEGTYYKNGFDISNNDANVKIYPLKNLNTVNDKYWQYDMGYRLGDTVLGKFHLPKGSLSNIAKCWPDSIKHKYKQKTSKNRDIDSLIEIVKEYNLSLPYGYISLHLRIGDRDGVYTSPLSYYKDVDIKKYTDWKKIIIFCGSHNVKSSRSNKYICDVVSILEKRGYDVFVRGGNSPDDDFVLISKSKYFIKGKSNKNTCGGYNSVLSSVVKKLGSTVIV
tara:strand:+ start:11340 stop:12008 length:669 start_codon:yes stop_codon:yes gene_type:complete